MPYDYKKDFQDPYEKLMSDLLGHSGKMMIFETIGWTHAYFCSELDKGNDPRKIDVSELIAKAQKDLIDERPETTPVDSG